MEDHRRGLLKRWSSIFVVEVVLRARVFRGELNKLPASLSLYRWVDRGEENGRNSIVTWRLEPESNGTHLFFEHEGFDPNHPLQLKGYQMMSQGWSRIVGQRLVEVLAED